MALKCGGIDAQPVIEEKKHCRTFGRGDQQILKFTHGVGADGIAHVRCEQPTIRTLVGENIEVIEPEIFHDRFELTIAVNGAVELAHGEFGDDSAGALHLRKALLERRSMLSLPVSITWAIAVLRFCCNCCRYCSLVSPAALAA